MKTFKQIYKKINKGNIRINRTFYDSTDEFLQHLFAELTIHMNSFEKHHYATDFIEFRKIFLDECRKLDRVNESTELVKDLCKCIYDIFVNHTTEMIQNEILEIL